MALSSSVRKHLPYTDGHAGLWALTAFSAQRISGSLNFSKKREGQDEPAATNLSLRPRNVLNEARRPCRRALCQSRVWRWRSPAFDRIHLPQASVSPGVRIRLVGARPQESTVSSTATVYRHSPLRSSVRIARTIRYSLFARAGRVFARSPLAQSLPSAHWRQKSGFSLAVSLSTPLQERAR